uniref:Uncharacterized protein n=1 Tax=Rhizophora mucronata TaxID=61149 RepID=A0A2P2QJD5_RHIMU
MCIFIPAFPSLFATTNLWIIFLIFDVLRL